MRVVVIMKMATQAQKSCSQINGIRRFVKENQHLLLFLQKEVSTVISKSVQCVFIKTKFLWYFDTHERHCKYLKYLIVFQLKVHYRHQLKPKLNHQHGQQSLRFPLVKLLHRFNQPMVDQYNNFSFDVVSRH